MVAKGPTTWSILCPVCHSDEACIMKADNLPTLVLICDCGVYHLPAEWEKIADEKGERF